jgi:hypothetical protein
MQTQNETGADDLSTPDPLELERALESIETCVQEALQLALRFGTIDVFGGGEQLRVWTIDQMVRALMGCTKTLKMATLPDGSLFQYAAYDDDAPGYQAFLKAALLTAKDVGKEWQPGKGPVEVSVDKPMEA